MKPDYGFHYGPTAHGGASPDRVLGVLGRNSLVLALHAFACVAGFIAGATLPLTAERHTGFSRLVHEKARPIAFAWVIGVTCFSLFTQTIALGLVGSTISWDLGISVPLLVLTALPHALLELTAVFLPLAAWTIASRKGRVGSAPRRDVRHRRARDPDADRRRHLGGLRLAAHPPRRRPDPGDLLGTAALSAGSDQLIELAVLRRLVVAPADDLRAVADAAAARCGRR